LFDYQARGCQRRRKLRSLKKKEFFNSIRAMPTDELNSHDVRFQAERIFI